MKKTALIVLDGVGLNFETLDENSIHLGSTPNLKNILNSGKYASLGASGRYVGILDGYMGNSEVGHLTIGSGRILKQSIVEINDLFEENKFDKLEAFKNTINFTKKNNNRLHLIGMIGFDGVHAHQEHLNNLIKVIPENINISLHIFTDGRDSGIKDSYKCLEKLMDFIKDYKNVEISSIGGRFYGMDRNRFYERNLKAYNSIIGEGEKTSLSPLEYLDNSYKKEIYDEFIEPISFEDKNYLKNGDACIIFNFRPDRAKQITEIISSDVGEDIIKYRKLKDIHVTTMVKTYDEYSGDVLIDKQKAENTLAEVLSNNGLRQLHLAETEKFAHVTKYFNGLKTDKFPKEEHILIPSHKVTSYDQDPDMSAYEILETFKENLVNYDFFAINFANGDMVGHTGDLRSAIKAIETIDKIIGKIIELSKQKDLDILFLADHGNCENMGDKSCKNTAHTTNPVPCFYIKSGELVKLKNSGGLADVAPTILDMMGIEKPSEMSGESLLV